MKIQKIVDICKKSGQLYITEAESAQWIGDGQAFYPIYDLPKLSIEDICVIYAIPEDKQDKMILNEKTVTELGGVSLSGLGGEEQAAEVIKMAIIYAGASYVILKCGEEISFVKRVYLTPFEEDVQLWKRKGNGFEYFVVTAGMFVTGIILPEADVKANIAADLKELAEKL